MPMLSILSFSEKSSVFRPYLAYDFRRKMLLFGDLGQRKRALRKRVEKSRLNLTDLDFSPIISISIIDILINKEENYVTIF